MIFGAVRTRSLLIVFRYRKIQELGLSSVYNSGTDSSVKKYIFGLPLLNPRDVGDCFAISAIQPICEKVPQFASFHFVSGPIIRLVYPNFFLFINELINVQVDTYIKIRSSLKIPKMYSTKTVQKQVFLQKHIDKVSKMKQQNLNF
nr:unnamed protein product [Callosobruchus analis]